MKAEEIRKISEISKSAREENQLRAIRKLILSAANNGEFHIYIYEYILPKIGRIFNEEGYKISSNLGRPNETVSKISWE